MPVIVNGLIAGLGLAGLLALGDACFGTETFAVLVDVSYVPGLANLPLAAELAIHLLISIVVVYGWMRFCPEPGGTRMIKYALSWLAVFSLLYVPFGFASGVAVNGASFAVWVAGHGLYTASLALLMRRRV